MSPLNRLYKSIHPKYFSRTPTSSCVLLPNSCFPLRASAITRMFSALACAVSAMLCEVVFSGVSSRVRSDGVEGEEVKGDMEFDVVLGQSELTEKALQLCHLLPPGFMPVSLYSYHTNAQPVCLIQWMFNGAEQSFILLCCLYLSQGEVLDCVSVCISLNVHASSG